MFACVYFHAPHATKWEVWEKKNKKKEKKYATGGERANRAVAAASVPLFFLCTCMSVRCRSFYSYSNCMYSEKEREKKKKKKKKERRARVHTHILQQSTLDNYDLWPRRMRVENIILSKDSRCRRHWLIVNKNNNNNNNYQRYWTLIFYFIFFSHDYFVDHVWCGMFFSQWILSNNIILFIKYFFTRFI